jgi:hypothetical protein
MVKVNCLKIDDVHLYYECPFCWKTRAGIKGTNIRPNGEVYCSAKPNIHKHGSMSGKIENGTAKRSSHCLHNNEEVEIVIDYHTPRKTPIPITVHFE